MTTCTFSNGDLELTAENEQDTFLLGKLAAKLKSAQVYPPGGGQRRSLRFEILELVRLATEHTR